MSNRTFITEGTEVLVDFTSERYSGTLVSRPTTQGELFAVRLKNGRIIEINPCCSSFESMCEAKDPS